MKVEMFTALDVAKCQTQVNLYLEKCKKEKKEVVDIKFTVAASSEGGVVHYCALLMYRD